MSTTYQQFAERLIDELEFAYYGTADSISSTLLTHAAQFQNANWNPTQFRGWWQERSQSATPEVRPTTLLTTAGALTNGGANWTTTGSSAAEKYYRVWHPKWHPTRYVRPLANRALEKAWEWVRTPITPVLDGDMQLTGQANWPGTNATPTKSLTVAWDQQRQSLHVVNSGANGGSRQTVAAIQGRHFRLSAKAYTITGTPYLAINDAANNAVATYTPTLAPLNAWHEISVSGDMPATTNGGQAIITLGGVLSSAVINWADVTLNFADQTRYVLPSWATAIRDDDGEPNFRLYKVINKLGYDGYFPATAYKLELIPSYKYQVLNTPSALSPIEIELAADVNTSLYPIIVEARRPYADYGSVTLDTDTNPIPLLLWKAAAKLLASEERGLSHRPKDKGGDGQWEEDYLALLRRYQPLLTLPAPDQGGLAWTVLD